MAEKRLLSEEVARHIVELHGKKVPVEEIASSMGLKSSTVKKTLGLVPRGYRSIEHHLASLAEQQGYPTRYDYRKHHEEKKASESFKAHFLGVHIYERLESLEKKPVWLAKKTGLSKVSISKYIRGRTLPNEENLQVLLRALDSEYAGRSIDDLTFDYVVRNVRAIKEKESSYKKA